MRDIKKIYKRDKLTFLDYGDDKFYTYNSTNELVVTSTPEINDIVMFNGRHLRSRDYIIKSLKYIANQTILKQNKTNQFALNRFTCNSTGEVLVGQGVGIPPVWKSYSTVFPATVYKVTSAEALRIENSTFTTTAFSNADISTYLFQNKLVNKNKFYDLKLNRLENATNFYSSAKVTVQFTPYLANIVKINNITQSNTLIHTKNFINNFDILVDYEFDATKSYTIYVYNNKFRTVRSFKSTFAGLPKVGEKFSYRCTIPSSFVTILGDDSVYIGDVEVKTSLTEKSRKITNYVSTGIESVNPQFQYTTEIRGENNSISASIPINITAKCISIAHHHGFYIDLNNTLIGFGTETKGEISQKPTTGKYKYVACGKNHNVALTDEGYLVSWGSNDFKQVSDTPKGQFKRIYAYDNISAAISENNELFIWGDSLYYTITPDTKMADIQEVAIGERFMLLRTINNDILCLGDDTYGQRTDIPVGRKFTSISAGKYHCIGIDDSRKMFIWGSNLNSQRNNSTITDDISDVACTDFGGVAITSDGTYKPFGNMTGTSAVKYYGVVTGNSNAVLLKNGALNIEHIYNTLENSGDALDVKITIDTQDVSVNKIFVDLDILK